MTNLANLQPRLKVPMFVSETLRDFAKGQDCTMISPWCSRDPEKTVLCHSRRLTGAGVGQKPHDFWAYHGCAECHAHEDQMGWDDLYLAIWRTQCRVYERFGVLTP